MSAVEGSPTAALRGQRVLVTGGAGLIGSHIVDGLVDAGASEIVVLDDLSRGRVENLVSAASRGPVRLVVGDIRDRELVASLLPGMDLVFHQAAIRITRCAEEPRLAREVLVDATFDLIEAAAESGVGRVVAASSASVYGQAARLPTTEDEPPWPCDTFYGAAKAFGEGMLRSFNRMSGLEYVALRYFNVYGPRMDTEGVYTEVLIRWMQRIEAGEPPLIEGDGEQTMDLMHVRDVARANLLAAVTPEANRAYNVGSGRQTSLRALATLLNWCMGGDLDPVHVAPRKAVTVAHRLADTTAARRHLGFRTEVELEDGLAGLVEWWRGERAGAHAAVAAPGAVAG